MSKKTIEQLFLESSDGTINYKGNKIIRIDKFPIKSGQKIKIVRESTNSNWKQGIRLNIDKGLVINDVKYKDIILWEDTAPKEVVAECQTKEGLLYVYNAWNSGSGRIDAWIGHSGMMVEDLPNGRRYRCNDGYPDDDFDDLVFRIEREA